MSRLLSPFLALAVVWSSWGIAAPKVRLGDCGGGGVVPMLTVSLSPHIDPVTLPDGIKNFAFWEKSDQVIYRNESDQLNSYHLDEGTIDGLANEMQYPVSHVVDPGERLVLTSQFGRIFDTFFSIWRWLLARKVPMEHLFFHPESVKGSVDNVLYSVAHDTDDQGQNIFQIYRYDSQEDNSAQKWCSAIPQDTQLDIHVAMGSAFPNVYLYKVQQTAMGYSLWISKIDVSSTPCQMTPFSVYPFYLSAPVKTVHWFQDDAFAISLTSGSGNLVWQNGPSCQIFSVGDGTQTPMVPNSATHVLALDEGNGQIQMVYPDQKLQGSVALPATGVTTDSSNIWLTNDRARLFLAPADSTGTRSLYQANIRALP